MLKGCTELKGQNMCQNKHFIYLLLISEQIYQRVTLFLPFSEKRKHKLFIELLNRHFCFPFWETDKNGIKLSILKIICYGKLLCALWIIFSFTLFCLTNFSFKPLSNEVQSRCQHFPHLSNVQGVRAFIKVGDTQCHHNFLLSLVSRK